MSIASAAARLQEVQQAVAIRSKGSGWSITNRNGQKVLAQQALRMERLSRQLLNELHRHGIINIHDNGSIRT